MASVVGSRSYLAGSGEFSTHLCGPCNEEGEQQDATFFCEVCNVYLCVHCKDEHKKFKATKNHSIISATSSPAQGQTSVRGSFKVLCGCDQKRPVESYCEDHATVICKTCEAIQHRNCRKCVIKKKVSKDTQKDFGGIMDKTKTLQTNLESCMQNGKANCKILDEKKTVAKKTITSFREKINNLLDKMEKESLASLEDKANELSQTLENHLSTLTATLQALSTDKNILEKANISDNDETRFAASVKISKNIAEYEVVVNDIIAKETQKPQLEFQENTNLTDVLNSMESLGRIEASELRSFQDSNKPILDMPLKSFKKVNIKIVDSNDTDHHDPYITGCSFLSDGSVILCDRNNCKVKLLDSNWSVKNSFKVPHYPYSLTVIDKTDAVITFDGNNKDLQYVHTYPDLKLGKKKTLPEKCRGLQMINDEIYTAYHKKSGHDEIWKLDWSFNIKSKIVLTQASSGVSCYFSVCNVTATDAHVYLTDWKNSKVTCVQLDGRVVFQYEDQSLKRSNGIYVDKAGNSIVCGADSNNVIIITADGRKHRELLTSKDITNPKCIDFRPSDNILITGSENCSTLVVCELGQ